MPRTAKSPRAKSKNRFVAALYRIWTMRYVDVPPEIVASLAKESSVAAPTKQPTKQSQKPAMKYIPVIAAVAGRHVRTTLLPAGDGRYRLLISAALRKGSHADVGDSISIELSADCESRELPIPADLRVALKQHPKAGRGFAALPPGYRRQVLKWMETAKGAPARARRIEMIVDRMLERAILPPRRGKSKS
jgi:hypothetical protein